MAMMEIYIWFGCLSFILGSVMASAMTCLGDRLAAHESWTKGRSHCDVCGHELEAVDLIPIFSYIIHGGKCRYCGAKLSKKYLLTELLMGALFVLIFFSEGMINVNVLRDWGVACALLALSITDLDSFIIPDRLIAFLIIWWAAFTVIFWRMGADLVPMLRSGLLGAALAGGFVLIISLIMDKVMGRETMGGGDIKLLFACGLYTGIAGGLFLIIASSIIGLIVMALAKKKQIPFGPSISLAAMLVILYGRPFIQWYMGLIGL